ncbi:MAG TPA: cytochrome b [Caulobacteraceae bacterium]|jgi:cytochrome b561|nr:cytochrome b [Caulobacteraceae bacterium]
MADARRYNAVAMSLHWLIAALILANIALAWWFNGLPLGLTPEIHGIQKARLLAIHKPIGITVLLLSLLRLAWRLISRPPPLPASVTGWERFTANSVYVLFYVVMIGMPLTGWIMVSASKTIATYPISFFGLFNWPAIGPLTTLPKAQMHQTHELFQNLHSWGAWLAYLLVILHVGAALRHLYLLKDDVFWRMFPFMRRPA